MSIESRSMGCPRLLRHHRSMVRRTKPWAVVIAFVTVAVVHVSGQRAAPAPIRQIDHVMIRTGAPRELYAFFTEVLQLPIAWPLTNPRPGVATGGVAFGNVNVEAIQVPGQKDKTPRLLGFAFEASPLDQSLTELDRRGITYGERRPLVVTGADGVRTVRWTNVTLRQFSDSDGPEDGTIHIFLSEYSPTYVDVGQRRARLRKELAQSGGGPLGVVAVKEIVVGVADLETARRLWQQLLDPVRASAPDVWQVGDGPGIRLVRARANTTRTLVVSVASLPKAKAFLRGRGLLGSESDEEASIDRSKIGGLDIRLVGAQPAR
jgi:catechol 2,3-dioxygenase-like lactoylglutathione lyase family enzyme